MKDVILAGIAGAVITLLLFAAFETNAYGAHLPQPSEQMRSDVVVQLNAFFPECVDMDWKIRTYMKRNRHWVLRVAPQDRACIGYRQFLVGVQGFGNDMISLDVREKIELPFSGRTSRVWVPLAHIGY